MHVLLFDIDGTLINSGGAGGVALRRMLQSEFGVADPPQFPLHGCTDRGIAYDYFTQCDIENTPENWIRFRDGYLKNLTVALPEIVGHVLPGVTTLLEQLAQRSDVVLGLLTGNVEAGAKAKLTHYKLFHHFHFGGFGDEHPDRDDVARMAHRAAVSHLGHSPQVEKIWVIGDTPADIRCGRAIQAQCVAVATGMHTEEQLGAAGPDLLLPNLSEATKLWKLP